MSLSQADLKYLKIVWKTVQRCSLLVEFCVRLFQLVLRCFTLFWFLFGRVGLCSFCRGLRFVFPVALCGVRLFFERFGLFCIV